MLAQPLRDHALPSPRGTTHALHLDNAKFPAPEGPFDDFREWVVSYVEVLAAQ